MQVSLDPAAGGIAHARGGSGIELSAEAFALDGHAAIIRGRFYHYSPPKQQGVLSIYRIPVMGV